MVNTLRLYFLYTANEDIKTYCAQVLVLLRKCSISQLPQSLRREGRMDIHIWADSALPLLEEQWPLQLNTLHFKTPENTHTDHSKINKY